MRGYGRAWARWCPAMGGSGVPEATAAVLGQKRVAAPYSPLSHSLGSIYSPPLTSASLSPNLNFLSIFIGTKLIQLGLPA